MSDLTRTPGYGRCTGCAQMKPLADDGLVHPHNEFSRGAFKPAECGGSRRLPDMVPVAALAGAR